MVAPQIVRPGSTYDVIVTILRATSSVDVEVKLLNARNDTVVRNRAATATGLNLQLYQSTATVEECCRLSISLSGVISRLFCTSVTCITFSD